LTYRSTPDAVSNYLNNRKKAWISERASDACSMHYFAAHLLDICPSSHSIQR
jgi:hypothetical protein